MKLLYFEDDPSTAAAYTSAFEDAGFVVMWLTRPPDQLLDFISKEHPDIIVTDIVMPGTSGIEATRQLKSSQGTQHIPLVILSSLSDAETKQAGQIAGANDYLVKGQWSPLRAAERIKKLVSAGPPTSSP